MMATTSAQHAGEYQQIHDGIIHLLDTARTETVRNINAIMTATYWEIGRRIVEFEQGGEARAAYGTQLIEQLSVDLTRRYKRGFSTRNLWQIRNFYLYFLRKNFYIHQFLYVSESGNIAFSQNTLLKKIFNIIIFIFRTRKHKNFDKKGKK